MIREGDDVDDESISPYLHDSDPRWRPGPVAIRAKAMEDAFFDRFQPHVNRKKTSARRTKKKKNNNKQPKITAKFSWKLSEDGYPLKDCEFEPLENKMVYRPKGYSEISRCPLRKHHCIDCHLKPCIVETFDDDSRKMCAQWHREGKTPNQIMSQTRLFFSRKHCRLFKMRYTKNYIPPACVQEKLGDVRYVYFDDPSDDESSGSEREFEFENGDKVPFGCVRDREVGDPPMEMIVESYKRHVDTKKDSNRKIPLYDADEIIAELEELTQKSRMNKIDWDALESSDEEAGDNYSDGCLQFLSDSSDDEASMDNGTVGRSCPVLPQFHSAEQLGIDPLFQSLEVIRKGSNGMEFVRVVSKSRRIAASRLVVKSSDLA